MLANLHAMVVTGGIAGLQVARSRQGKVEQSLLSFAATYPGWAPDAAAAQMLASVSPAGGLPGLGPEPARAVPWGVPGPEAGHPVTASSMLGTLLRMSIAP